MHHRLEIGKGAHHQHPVNAFAALVWLVVEEADGTHAELRVLLHLAHDERSRVAGARDQHQARRPHLARPLCGLESDSPTTRIDRRMPEMHAKVSSQSMASTDRGKKGRYRAITPCATTTASTRARGGDRQEDQLQIAYPGIPPVAPVQPEEVEHEGLQEQRGHQEELKGRGVVGLSAEEPIESQHEGAKHAERDGRDVGREHVAVTHACSACRPPRPDPAVRPFP